MNQDININILGETLILKRHDNLLVVVSDKPGKEGSAETFRHKNELKASGFRWNPALNSWVIPSSQLKHAQDVLADINKSKIEKYIEQVSELPEFVEGTDNWSKKQELSKKIEQYAKELVSTLDSGKVSEELQKFFEFSRKFRKYSLHNTFLIYFQKPDATFVAGAKQWFEKHRRKIKKGATPIFIFAPIAVSVKKTQTKGTAEKPEIEKPEIEKPDSMDDVPEESVQNSPNQDPVQKLEKESIKDQKVLRYRVVRVFDISDTEPIDEKSTMPPKDPFITKNEPDEKSEKLFDAAIKFASDLGIRVDVSASKQGEYGYSTGGKINITSTYVGVNRLAILIHEIAHELLHHGEKSLFYDPEDPVFKDLTRNQKEIQVETITYVVLRYFELPVQSSINYIQMYRGTSEGVTKILNLIKKVSNFVIDKLESYL